jgi:DNA repair protein RadC
MAKNQNLELNFVLKQKISYYVFVKEKKRIMNVQKFNLIMEKSKDYNIFTGLKPTAEPADAYELAKVFQLHKQPEEVFAVAGFDIQGRPTSYFEVHRGTLHQSVVGVKEIFKRLILANAHTFMAFHNHPSGLASPSPADEHVTKELKNVGRTLEIDMLDHIIVGDDVFYSFAENRKL